MIPIELIKSFASTDVFRPELHHPWIDDEQLVASDGRVLVVVPLNEVEAASMPPAPAFLPQWRNVLSAGVIGPADEPMAPPVPRPEPPMEPCLACNGDGSILRGKRTGSKVRMCGDCGGAGRRRQAVWIADFEHGIFDFDVIARILWLPSVRWFQPLPSSPRRVNLVPFRFGVAGRGAAMPCRFAAAR